MAQSLFHLRTLLRSHYGARAEQKQARGAEVLRWHAQGMPLLSLARQRRRHRPLVRQSIRVAVLPRVLASGRRPQLDC